MITIQQLKLPPDHSEQDLKKAVARTLRLSEKQPFSFEIIRQSVDARKKPDIFYVYTVDVTVSGDEKKILKKNRNRSLSLSKRPLYHFPEAGKEPLNLPPVIIGTGPAGLFCGLMLARAGYRPVLLERGQAVEERQKAVEHFWQTGVLNPECNVQFGEGGAGTFSDGKLNTLVKDPADPFGAGNLCEARRESRYSLQLQAPCGNGRAGPDSKKYPGRNYSAWGESAL